MLMAVAVVVVLVVAVAVEQLGVATVLGSGLEYLRMTLPGKGLLMVLQLVPEDSVQVAVVAAELEVCPKVFRL